MAIFLLHNKSKENIIFFKKNKYERFYYFCIYFLFYTNTFIIKRFIVV